MNKKILSVLFLLFILNTGIHGEFAPWQKKVNVADENLNICDKHKSKDSPVYNGFQGGAYFLLRFFQVVISPQDGPNCHHTPVCSAYARGSVIKHGAFAGSLLAGDRLLRCNPFYYLDNDPVPDEVLGE
ncbi:MAG: membrane protein insertion efficiency factor YidD [Spirochaetota bacterium]